MKEEDLVSEKLSEANISACELQTCIHHIVLIYLLQYTIYVCGEYIEMYYILLNTTTYYHIPSTPGRLNVLTFLRNCCCQCGVELL